MRVVAALPNEITASDRVPRYDPALLTRAAQHFDDSAQTFNGMPQEMHYRDCAVAIRDAMACHERLEERYLEETTRLRGLLGRERVPLRAAGDLEFEL